MKQLMENWQKHLKEKEVGTIDTKKGPVPIDKELKYELENLPKEEMDAVLQAFEQASESDPLKEWDALFEGVNLDTGLMSRLKRWSKSVGLAAAIIGVNAIAGAPAHAASPSSNPIEMGSSFKDDDFFSGDDFGFDDDDDFGDFDNMSKAVEDGRKTGKLVDGDKGGKSYIGFLKDLGSDPQLEWRKHVLKLLSSGENPVVASNIINNAMKYAKYHLKGKELKQLKTQIKQAKAEYNANK